MIKSIGALVRFELSARGLNISHQTLLIGGVLKFVEDNWVKCLFDVRELHISNDAGTIAVQLDVSMNYITGEPDSASWFDNVLKGYLEREYAPGYCPVRTSFRWKWDRIYRLQDVGEGNIQAYVFCKPERETP